jgi:hypothetical protein
MKITEILVESQQVDEGPLLNKIGAGIGKVAGTVAKGVGSVAGGIAGVGSALAKGYKAGKKAVSAGGDDTETDPATDGTAPAAGGGAAAPAASGGAPAASGGAPAASGGAPAAAPATTAPAAKPTSTFGKLSAAANGQAPAADPAAGGTQYAQVKANIDKLDKKGKQRILQLLQKEVGTAPAAPAKTPAADPGAGAMGAMAGQLAKGGAAEPNTMANAPVSKTNKAKPGNPNAAPEPGMTADGQPHYDPATGKGAKFDGVTGEMTPAWKAEQDKQAAAKQTKAAPAQQDKAPAPAPAAPTTGQAATQAADAGGNPEQAALDAMKAKNPKLAGMMAQAGMDDQGNDVEPVKKKGGKKKPAAPSQATMDADRERNMGPTSDSIIRTRPMMAEGFSLFRKR